jgi:hypothetical protein
LYGVLSDTQLTGHLPESHRAMQVQRDDLPLLIGQSRQGPVQSLGFLVRDQISERITFLGRRRNAIAKPSFPTP